MLSANDLRCHVINPDVINTLVCNVVSLASSFLWRILGLASESLCVLWTRETPVLLSAATLSLSNAGNPTTMATGVTVYNISQESSINLPTEHPTCCLLLVNDSRLFAAGVEVGLRLTFACQNNI
jgi:hypothetical protein